jgi:hypothetical protein
MRIIITQMNNTTPNFDEAISSGKSIKIPSGEK